MSTSVARVINQVRVILPHTRKVLDSSFALKRQPGKTVSIELAKETDDEQLANFLAKHFVYDEPLSSTLGINAQEQFVLINEQVKDSTRQGYTFIAVDNGEVVGLLSSAEKTKKKIEKVPEVPEDFGPLFDKYSRTLNVSRKCATFCALADYVEEFTSAFIPYDDKKFLVHHVGQVAKPFTGNDLFQRFVKETAISSVENDVLYVSGVYSALRSTKVALRMGLKLFMEVKMRDCYDYGKPIFRDGRLTDGNNALRLLIGESKSLAEYH